MPFTSRFRLKFRWAKLAAACLVLTGCDKPPPAAAPTSEPAALQTTAPKPLAFGACADPNVIATVLMMVFTNYLCSRYTA